MYLLLWFMFYGILFYFENILKFVKIMCIFYKLCNDDELIKFVCVYLGFRSCFKLMDNI